MTARPVMAVLLDEMLSGAIAGQVRTRGSDGVPVVEDPTLVGTADEDLLAHAAVAQCVLVTVNVADFSAIATDWRAAGRGHAGLIYVTNRTFAQDRYFVGAIVSALAALSDADELPQPGTETFLRRTSPRNPAR
ncbi:MAG: DUF5615 family PIN-like protein [Jatrophihabitantaceae bacterium]